MQILRIRWPMTAAAALVLTIGTYAAAAPQVKTALGTVEGTSSADGKVRAFRGMPFAAPPVGELRWQAPRPPVAVGRRAPGGERSASGACRAASSTTSIFRDEPSEDCLYLNVWTPAHGGGRALPVMVWIHGGGFQAGSASEPRQDGERLAAQGRRRRDASTTGWACSASSRIPSSTKESGTHASGNYGLLDQIAALQWVQDNIAAFGGDPGNVTIFGESAGSFAVSALMASPLAQGLFHRAIGESGAFFSRGGGHPAPQTLQRAKPRA